MFLYAEIHFVGLPTKSLQTRIKMQQPSTLLTFSQARKGFLDWKEDPNRFWAWKPRFADIGLGLEPRFLGESRASAQLRKVAARDLIVRMLADPSRIRAKMGTLTVGFLKDLIALEESYNVRNIPHFGSPEHKAELTEFTERAKRSTAPTLNVFKSAYSVDIIESSLCAYDCIPALETTIENRKESYLTAWYEVIDTASTRFLLPIDDPEPISHYDEQWIELLPDDVQDKYCAASQAARRKFVEAIFPERRRDAELFAKRDRAKIAKRAAHNWRHNPVTRLAVLRADAKKKQRGQPWTVSRALALEMIAQPCAYCGGFSQGHTVNSLDRLDSTDTYRDGNVVSACYMCNWMKMNYNVDTFLQIAINVSAHQNKEPVDHAVLPDYLFRQTTPTLALYETEATKRGYDFELTLTDFDSLIYGDCYYCGRSPVPVCNGVDRYDNDRAYTIDNVVSCCWVCNRVKNKWSVAEFYQRMQLLAENAEIIRDRIEKIKF